MYAKLKGAKVFSTIDLRSGYHHITLGKSSRAKTAFVMPFGKYEFLMVPFGLAQAPAYFHERSHNPQLTVLYRLVLRTHNFTIETVFYIKCMCILSNTNSFRTNCTH